MSANLYWEPVKRKKHDLRSSAPSSFMEKLEKAFGSRTPTLRQRDIPTLRGMAVATDNSEWRENFEALADAIETHEEIEITAEY